MKWRSGAYIEGKRMSKDKKSIRVKIPFDESLFGIFYDIFRTAGLQVGDRQMERLRLETHRIAKVIEAETRLATIKQIKRVQMAIKDGFDEIEEKLEKQGAVAKTLFDAEKNLSTIFKELDKSEKNTDN